MAAGMFLFLAAVCSALAAAAPLTVKEIALMLRSGYSNETVLHDLSVRHFADNFDSETEMQLLRAGANSSLIETLRSGTYQVSTAQIAAAKTKIATPPATMDNVTTPPNASPVPSQSPPPPQHDSILSRLKGDLIYLHQGTLVPFDDEELEQKKFYLLFFSAVWSAPGRKFTSQLVDYYNRVAPDHPEFEVIFFSADRSQFGMENYMLQNAMPWPAVAYDKRNGKAGDIQGNLVKEIPALIFAEASGRVLSYSHSDGAAVSLEQVLADTDRFLKHGPDSAVQAAR